MNSFSVSWGFWSYPSTNGRCTTGRPTPRTGLIGWDSSSFNRRDFSGAVPHFDRAYGSDSTFATALIYAAQSYENMGRSASADSALSILTPSKDDLHPNDRFLLDYVTANLAGDRTGRLDAARALSVRAPMWGEALAISALADGRPEEALQAIEKLDLDRPGYRVWSFIWYRLAFANHLTERYREQLEAARRAQEYFPEDFRLRAEEIWALVGMGKLLEAEPLLEVVEGMRPEGSWHPGRVYWWVAAELERHGHPEQAERVAERAVEWYEARDPEAFRRSFGAALLLAGRSEDALVHLDREVEENPEDVETQGLYGIALAQSADVAGAEARARWLEELERPYVRGGHTYWRSRHHRPPWPA